jgi:hypothetical protein
MCGETKSACFRVLAYHKWNSHHLGVPAETRHFLVRITHINMDENLQIVYNHCIFHLDSIHAQSISKLHFKHNGGRSWIYSRSFPCPLSFEILDQPITDSMLILQIVGEISSIETVPTAEREGQDEVGNDGVHVACWVEPRSDTASRTLWGRIRQSLDGVAEATDVKLNFSQLFAVDEVTGVPRLKVVWMPSQGVSTH